MRTATPIALAGPCGGTDGVTRLDRANVLIYSQMVSPFMPITAGPGSERNLEQAGGA